MNCIRMAYEQDKVRLTTYVFIERLFSKYASSNDEVRE
jgi:hypothetical protein